MKQKVEGVMTMENAISKSNGLLRRTKLGWVIGLLTIAIGCAGSWSGDGEYYGTTVVVPEPDQYLFGGIYYNSRDAHMYGHRGYESRGAAHPSAKRSEEHSNGNHGGKR